MNFNEGMRRIGLIAGIFGAGICTLIGWSQIAARIDRPANASYEQRSNEPATDWKTITAEVNGVVRTFRAQVPTGAGEEELKAIVEREIAKQHLNPNPMDFALEGRSGPATTKWQDFRTLAFANPGEVVLLGLALPLAGFAIPWVAVKALVWIVGGFTKGRNSI
jgi:hypothetical protein